MFYDTCYHATKQDTEILNHRKQPTLDGDRSRTISMRK